MARRRISAILNGMSDEVVREVEQALFAGGEAVAVEAQVSITEGSASGTSGGRHQHTPSEPGQPPNNFTGTLAGNIEVTRAGRLKVEVASTALYSEYLEFGTSRMAARPFMAPAANAKRREVNKLVDKAVKRAIRRGHGNS